LGHSSTYPHFVGIERPAMIFGDYILHDVDCGWISIADCRTLDRIQDRNSKSMIQMPSLGPRLALYGCPYRPAMMEH
jgi:hypothetical protein